MFDIPKNQKPWLKIKKYILFATLLNELLIPKYALNYHCFLNVNCITALGYNPW